MKSRTLLTLIGLFLVTASVASAQQRVVHGKVTSESGTPLGDAKVSIK